MGGVGEYVRAGVGGCEGANAVHIREQMLQVAKLHLAHMDMWPGFAVMERLHEEHTRGFMDLKCKSERIGVVVGGIRWSDKAASFRRLLFKGFLTRVDEM